MLLIFFVSYNSWLGQFGNAINWYLHPHGNMYFGNRDWDQISHFNIVSKVSSFKFERGIKISQHVKDSSSGTFWQFYALQNNRKRQFWV